MTGYACLSQALTTHIEHFSIAGPCKISGLVITYLLAIL